MSTLADLRRPIIVPDTSLATIRAWNKHTTDNIDRLNLASGRAFAAAQTLVGPISRVRSSGLALTTDIVTNVCTTESITLTAGKWEIHGAVAFQPAATTTVSEIIFGVSATSATLPTADTIAVPTSGEVRYDVNYPTSYVPRAEITCAIAPYRVTVAEGESLTLYLIARSTFGTSTCKTYGSLEAQQIA